MSQIQQVPPVQITLDQLHREYGEAMIQLEICNQRVMMLKQQIQQVYQGQAQQQVLTPKPN